MGSRTTYYLNYSYQAEPVPNFPGFTAAQALTEVNLPAKHRFNAGVTASVSKLFCTLDASMVDKAFWQDVLDSRYQGNTPQYTVANLVLGTKLAQDKVQLQVRVNNLGGKAIQQHIFGDVMKRSLMVELKINAPKK